jgi:tripartite-type tricarboxylate transporter receptor subunit TctC
VKDFEPVCLLAENPNVLVVAPGLPVRSVKDLIELARARPGALTFSSGGSGTSQHLAGEMLAIATGTRLLHVPYKSTPQSVNAVLAGEVDMTFASVPVALPHVQGGKVRALAVTSARPVSMWPDLPTLASQGVPAFDVSAWFGLMAPAGTPRPIVDRLNAALVRILEMPSVKDKLRAQGMQPLGGSPSDFGSKVKSEIDRWGTVVRSAGVTLN